MTEGTSGMLDVEERKIGEYMVRIDRTLCVGFGDCIDAAPEIFAFDEEGICIFADAADVAERERLVRACDTCPVDALTLIDRDGNQVVP